MADLELEGLVARLPELYQPIYGDEPGASSRAADLPRTASIMESAELLERHVGRPLRIIDLGSSQGYLAFMLAERGHHVTGIDYLPINVQVAHAIHDRHPELDVAFIEGDVTDATLMAGLADFDLVLGLSILHHVVYSDGLEGAVALVDHLSQHVEHGLFEMALRTEPMYWAEPQPCDPRVVLTSYPFIRQIASSPTHLSGIDRPLLFCSSTVAMLSGELHPIRAFSESSHAAAPDVVRGRRRYFVLDAGLMKIAARFADDTDDEQLTFDLREELRHEAEVLGSLADSSITVPKILEFADNADETIIAKTMHPGELVSVVNQTLDDTARTRITDDVVAELARYEEHGWYHTDLRLWNVIWDKVGGAAHLIDHGALAREPGDVVWPGDASYSFAAFLCALWSVADDRTGLTAPRALPIGAKAIPTRVLTLLDWTLRQRRDRQFFRDAQAVWTASSDGGDVAGWPSLGWEWLLAFGEQLDRVRAEMDEEVRRGLLAYEKLHGEYESALQGYDDLQAAHDEHVTGYENLHALYDSALASYSRLEGLYNSSTTALDELRTGHEALVQLQSEDRRALESTAHRLAQIESSFSWRVTRPLRFIRRLLG